MPNFDLIANGNDFVSSEISSNSSTKILILNKAAIVANLDLTLGPYGLKFIENYLLYGGGCYFSTTVKNHNHLKK